MIKYKKFYPVASKMPKIRHLQPPVDKFTSGLDRMQPLEKIRLG